MKLYFSPGACSLSPHIVAAELGLGVELEKVDLASKKTASGRDYLEINPKGYVPALELDDGEVLTEGPAIVQYLADQRPEAKLAPAHGTLQRYRLQELLGYINAEVHKTYSPLFRPISDELRADRVAYLQKRYGVLNDLLAKQPYLLGSSRWPTLTSSSSPTGPSASRWTSPRSRTCWPSRSGWRPVRRSSKP